MWRSRICGWKTKMQCKNFLTVDIAVTTSHEMVLFSSDSFISFDTMFLVWNKNEFFFLVVCVCKWHFIGSTMLSFHLWHRIASGKWHFSLQQCGYCMVRSLLMLSTRLRAHGGVSVWWWKLWFFVFLQSCFCALICGVLFLFPYHR